MFDFELKKDFLQEKKVFLQKKGFKNIKKAAIRKKGFISRKNVEKKDLH